MYRATLKNISLEQFEDGNPHEQTLRVTFIEFSGRHKFVSGDGANWDVNQTQPCEDNAICTLADGKNEVQVEIRMLGWDENNASREVSVNGGVYKLNFSRS